MLLLHLDPDDLYRTAQLLQQHLLTLDEGLFNLRVQYHRLEMAWGGDRARSYLNDVYTVLTQLEQQLNELDALALILARYAEAWQESDQRWATLYREIR